MKLKLLLIFPILLAFLAIAPQVSSAVNCGTYPALANIVACVPFNVTNLQSNALAANTAIPVNFNAGLYSTFLTSTINNIAVYNTISGATTPTFMAGNVANEIELANFNTANNILLWVDFPDNVPASTTDSNWALVIGNTVNANPYLGNTIAQFGEAPQLSCTNPGNTLTGCGSTQYAQYDDGANVFNIYTNFAGKALPAGWGLTSSATGTFVVDNSILEVSAGSATYGVNTAITSALALNGLAIQSLIFPKSNNFQGIGFGNDMASNAFMGGIGISAGTLTADEWFKNTFTAGTALNSKSDSVVLNTPYEYQTIWAGNYLLANDLTGGVSVANVPSKQLSLGQVTNAFAVSFGTAVYQWVGIGTAPPINGLTGNSVYPSVVFSSPINFMTGNPTPSQPIINIGGSVVLQANPSGGILPYSYQWWTGTNSVCNGGGNAAIAGATANVYTASPSISQYFCYFVQDSNLPLPDKGFSGVDLVGVDGFCLGNLCNGNFIFTGANGITITYISPNTVQVGLQLTPQNNIVIGTNAVATTIGNSVAASSSFSCSSLIPINQITISGSSTCTIGDNIIANSPLTLVNNALGLAINTANALFTNSNNQLDWQQLVFQTPLSKSPTGLVALGISTANGLFTNKNNLLDFMALTGTSPIVISGGSIQCSTCLTTSSTYVASIATANNIVNFGTASNPILGNTIATAITGCGVINSLTLTQTSTTCTFGDNIPVTFPLTLTGNTIGLAYSANFFGNSNNQLDFYALTSATSPITIVGNNIRCSSCLTTSSTYVASISTANNIVNFGSDNNPILGNSLIQTGGSSQFYSAGNGLALNGNMFSAVVLSPLTVNSAGIGLASSANLFINSNSQLDFNQWNCLVIVCSLNNLYGNIVLTAGTNIVITPSGQNIQIASTGGGGGSSGNSLNAFLPPATAASSNNNQDWLGAIFIAFSIIFFILRVMHIDKDSYAWAIVLFISALLMFFGFYFSTFPYQSNTSSTSLINATSGNVISNSTVTTTFPHANVNSWEFVMFISMVVAWCTLMILIGIATMLYVQKTTIDEANDKMFGKK